MAAFRGVDRTPSARVFWQVLMGGVKIAKAGNATNKEVSRVREFFGKQRLHEFGDSRQFRKVADVVVCSSLRRANRWRDAERLQTAGGATNRELVGRHVAVSTIHRDNLAPFCCRLCPHLLLTGTLRSPQTSREMVGGG